MPAAVHGAAEERNPPWMLLEVIAYIKDVQNASTAVSKTSDSKHIQVTFCSKPPPFLSRFCIYTPDGAHLYRKPHVVAVEEDLVLIHVDVGAGGMYEDYYVYQADGGSGKPSLTLLPRTPRNLHLNPKDIGMLRRPGKEYIVAGFRILPFDYPPGGFSLCVYDSKQAGWRVYPLSLSLQARLEYGQLQERLEYEDGTFLHKKCKVVTIGGDAGTMAFVDLWRGMLFCDVLEVEREAARQVQSEPIPLLGYVSLPDDLGRIAKLKGDARLYRDIAFLDGHLKCVDLSSRSLWIRPATRSGAWSQQYMIRSFKEIEDSNQRTNLLPGHKDVYPSFRGLLVCQPVIGLEDDNARILYFTIKTHQKDDHASVLAVDMVTKKIQGVAAFFSRYEIINFTYVHSRLSKHFPGAQVMVSQGSSSNMKDRVQEQLGGASVAEYGDAMALDII
ncbi:unnamed protein product [Urochloa humidicola]